MQMQLARDGARKAFGAAVLVVAEDRMADQRHVGAQLVLAPGDRLQRHPGERRRALSITAKWVTARCDSAFSPAVAARTRSPCGPSALIRAASILALGRLRHALDRGPVHLAHAAGGEQLAEVGGHRAPLGHHQDARGVAVEAMDEARPLAELGFQPLQHAVDVPGHARAALDGEAGRLVEDIDVVVLIDHHVGEGVALLGGERPCLVGRSGPREGEVERRHLDLLIGLQPRVALGPAPVHPHLAGAQELVEVGVGELGIVQVEPAVEPHAGLVGGDAGAGEPGPRAGFRALRASGCGVPGLAGSSLPLSGLRPSDLRASCLRAPGFRVPGLRSFEVVVMGGI
jgi:hypothetical protein